MKNSTFARFARAFFIFGHFADVLVPSATGNDLFCTELFGRREDMATNVRFCLLMSEALVPNSYQDS